MVSAQKGTRQILIVEDDDNTAEMVTTLLDHGGYRSSKTDTGKNALEIIQKNPPHLVLLDLDLPDIDGLDVLQRIRGIRRTIPIIVVSGFDKHTDRVRALDAGADDYIGKPFSPEELIARIQALLRRADWTPQTETLLVINELELDMLQREARMNNRSLDLTPVEYGLLITLMRHAGQTLSHDELLRAVWGESYEGDYSVLRVNISRLRQKLKENSRHPAYIITVPGEGYRMRTHDA